MFTFVTFDAEACEFLPENLTTDHPWLHSARRLGRITLHRWISKV